MIDKSELKFKVNRDIYNLDDFKPYLAEGKSLLSENGARRMIHKNTGEIVYFKPLLFQEFIASQITHAIFPNHTVVCGIGYKNNEEDFKEYYLYSKSPLNDGVDTRKFLDEYQSPIKHLNYGIKAEGLQFAVFALNLLLNDCDYNGNIIVHDGKAIRIDYDGLFEFENISNGDDITISQPKLLNSYMLTISNAVRAGAKLEVSDLQSALESCVELLKHINSDSRKILNKFFLEAYKFGLEINVFSSDKEMHDELLQYKSNFYILHPKNIDRLELFIEKLNEFNTIYDIKFITPPDAKPLNYNKDFLEFIINNL